jgi:hypothetical protein
VLLSGFHDAFVAHVRVTDRDLESSDCIGLRCTLTILCGDSRCGVGFDVLR